MSRATPPGASPREHGRDPDSTTFDLLLYVAGQQTNSTRAIENLHRICEEYLAGLHHIEIVDLLEHPEVARVAELFAVPTLVRRSPEPVRTIIGDLSDTPAVLAALGLPRTRSRNLTVGANRGTSASRASPARHRADARWLRDPPSDRPASPPRSPDET